MITLQDYLIKKRKELKLSLRSAAELIGISHSYLSTLEKGIDPRNNTPVKPTPETLNLISDAYKIPYDYLMVLAGYMDYEKKKNKLDFVERILTEEGLLDGDTDSEKLEKILRNVIKIYKDLDK